MTPSVDFNKVEDLMPPSKRLPKFLSWFRGVVCQLIRLQLIFKYYLYGYDIFWDSSTQYYIGDYVVDNHKVYQQINYNTLNLSPTSDGIGEYWLTINNSFIGMFERSRYCCQKITLEWALNHFFEKELSDNGYSGFKQPPLVSHIYIENDIPEYGSFVSGKIETNSSFVYSGSSTGFVFTGSTFTNVSSYLFTVNIPTSVGNSIGAYGDMDSIVHKFLDKYIPVGIKFTINLY